MSESIFMWSALLLAGLALVLGGASLWWRWRTGAAPVLVVDADAPEPVAADEGDATAALYTAARAGHVARALQLLDAGADAHALPPPRARDQRSLLALAAVLADLELLRALIARGVYPNQRHAEMSALLAATRDSWHGRPDAVTMLIANGADPQLADSDGNTPLHHAARSSDPAVAALLCDAGAALDARNHEGVTPLGMACASGNWRLAKFLIARGAKPESVAAVPALLSAAATGADDPAGIHLLLGHKAKVNSCDARGRSALHEAARHGHVDILHALLAAGAKVDVRDADGISPLLDAVRGGHLAALDALIAAGADRHALDVHGRSALALACRSDGASAPLVQRLLDAGVNADMADTDGRRAVDHAVEAGHWALVTLLEPDYPLPASVSDDGADGQPPLDLLRAALRGGETDGLDALVRLLDSAQLGQLLLEPGLAEHPEQAAWLLAQGADPNQRDAAGNTPLQCLIERLPHSLATLQVLLHHHATATTAADFARLLEVCVQGDHGARALEQCALDWLARTPAAAATIPGRDPPLTLAVRLGWDRLIEHLARTGADLNAHDHRGLAALHLAAALGRPAAVRLLLRFGAALNGRTRDGQTALGIALISARAGLAEWLDWRGWPLPERALEAADIPAAAMSGDTDAVLRLLALGLPLEASDDKGCTALLRAAGGGHLELVQRLIERGANIHHAALSGATPLSAAISMNHTDIIAALLAAGADPKQGLPGGISVLMLAAARGLPEPCRQLLAAGADVHAHDPRGYNALHCAAQYAFSTRQPQHLRALMETLLQAGAAVNATTSSGYTPLLLLLGVHAEAGGAGDEGAIALALEPLLAAGARVDVQDAHGAGPLHLAALHGLAHVARRLLAAGVDPELRDAHGHTPREIATLCGFVEIAAELAPPRAHLTRMQSTVPMARFLHEGG